MSYRLIYPATRETPAEYGPSDSPATCYTCSEIFDMDDDPYHLIETPTGEVRVCDSCTHHMHWDSSSGKFITAPALTCGCGTCEIPIRKIGSDGHWQTQEGVIVLKGKLWLSDCSALGAIAKESA